MEEARAAAGDGDGDAPASPLPPALPVGMIQGRHLAAARGVGEGQRVNGGGAEEEHERKVDLTAAVGALYPGSITNPAAAVFSPSPPPPGHHEQHLAANAAGRCAGAEEEERHEQKIDLAAALNPGPSSTPTAAIFCPSPPAPRHHEQHLAANAAWHGAGAEVEEEEEERHEHKVFLTAALNPGSSAPATAAISNPSPATPRHHEQRLAANGAGNGIGEKMEWELASHRKYSVAGEVHQLKRFQLYLESWEQVLKDREDALNRRERVVEEAHLRLVQQALKVQEDTLRTPLLQKKNDDTWNWRVGIVSMIAVVNVLMALLQIRPLLPRNHFQVIVCTLAILWAPCSIVLADRVSGRYRTGKKLRFHVTRLIWLCFSLSVMYALYLI